MADCQPERAVQLKALFKKKKKKNAKSSRDAGSSRQTMHSERTGRIEVSGFAGGHWKGLG